MKKLIIPALCLALAACAGGGHNHNDGALQQADGQDSKTAYGMAYEICLKINEQAKDFPPEGNDAKLEYSFIVADDKYDIDNVVSVHCIPSSDGSYLAVYQVQEDGVLGDGYMDEIKDFRVFSYKDGNLADRSNLLPKPTFEDFKAADGLLVTITDTEFDKYRTQNKYEYRSHKDGIIVNLNEETLPWIAYKWDGAKFVIDGTPDGYSCNIINVDGIGNVRLGSHAPEKINGYTVSNSGKSVVYNRNGKKAFSVALGSDMNIDTIIVFSSSYTFQMCCTGGCNNFGVGYRGSADCFGMTGGYGYPDNDYYVLKNGVWVRTIERANTTKFEFYATKNSITNIKPENGKVVTPADNPSFATGEVDSITMIKIYRLPSFCETCDKLSDDAKVLKIRELYNGIASAAKIENKSFEVEDSESGQPLTYHLGYVDGRLVMVEFEVGDSWVYNYKIYFDGSCPIFCLLENRYPDGKKSFERIYLCDNKIFRYLDNSKQQLDITDTNVQDIQERLLAIVAEAMRLAATKS